MEIKTKLIKIDWLPKEVAHGYGCGYIGVPPDHPWHGMNYEELYKKYEIDVHGGLTWARGSVPQEKEYTNYWWFGFDTCHPNDNMHNCNENFCKQEIENLKQQALNVI